MKYIQKENQAHKKMVYRYHGKKGGFTTMTEAIMNGNKNIEDL